MKGTVKYRLYTELIVKKVIKLKSFFSPQLLRKHNANHCKKYGSIRSRRKVEKDRSRLGRTDDSDYGEDSANETESATSPIRIVSEPTLSLVIDAPLNVSTTDIDEPRGNAGKPAPLVLTSVAAPGSPRSEPGALVLPRVETDASVPPRIDAAPPIPPAVAPANTVPPRVEPAAEDSFNVRSPIGLCKIYHCSFRLKLLMMTYSHSHP